VKVIDFGGYPVFEATVDTNIILFKKKNPDANHRVKFVNVTQTFLSVKNDLIPFIEKNYKTILKLADMELIQKFKYLKAQHDNRIYTRKSKSISTT